MNPLIPDFEDRGTALSLLVLAEALTKRGQPGPLARVFVCRPKAKTASELRPEDPAATPKDKRER